MLLAGTSGAGKSTLLQLLHAITGALPAVSGDATGSLLVGDDPPAASRWAVGLVLQAPDSQVILARVGDDVAFGMENLGLPAGQIPARLRTALETVGLSVELDHPTRALSGGQKQRLAIAGVLAMEPGVLVLDEPTANLDPNAVHSVRDAVLAAQARSGTTMVVVEHRLEIWALYVDRIAVLGPQGLLADGNPNAVLGDMRLRDCLQAAGHWLPGAVSGVAYTPTMRGEEMLYARDTTVARPGAEPVATVSAKARAGRALALTGPSGSGKSTTALTLAGLIPEAAGTVTASQSLQLAGPHRPKCAQPSRWKSRALVTRIGMVFQEADHQFLRHTLAEELAFGPRQAGYSKSQIQARVDELLERLKLGDLAQAHPQTLSGGEKRRLSLACMLTAVPQVLIVDEPTFGRDALQFGGLGLTSIPQWWSRALDSRTRARIYLGLGLVQGDV